MNSNLKDKTVSSMIWNAIQRFGTMALSFISNLILARILAPSDFGAIGMLSIFIVLSEQFIDGGLGSALIQKKDPSQADYSTVFYWNMSISLLLFILIQFAAPSIAAFYNMPILTDILRVVSVVIIINAFSVVQTNILTKQLSFKVLARINLISTLIGVVLSIIFAYLGYGIWSLVIKSLATALVTASLLWIFNTWRPSLVFSLNSMKGLFGFGSLMLLSNLLNALFENIQGLIIGKKYTAQDMGLYSQAKKVDELPSRSISQIVTRVSFPVFSQIADDKNKLVSAVRNNIICTTYLIFPLQFMLICVADHLFIVLFTEKWLAAVPYFRIFCIYSMFISLNAINTNVYKALGKSNIYFWVQLVKKILALFLIVMGMNYGVKGMTWATSISGILWWIISSIINGRLIKYGLFSQIKDIVIPFVISAVICLGVFLILRTLQFNHFGSLALGMVSYIALYLLFSIILKLKPYKIYLDIIISRILKKKS